jgi:predicted lipoprotein with Yx(FWY)xxD motif
MRFRTRQVMLALSFAAGLGVAACGSASTASSHGSGTPEVSAKTIVDAATVSVAGRQERILVTGGGMTLYYFTADQDGKMLACSGSCLTAWPPDLLPHGASPSSQGSLPGKLGTIERPDGTRQVTYDGWPLYRFGGDKARGDANGQGVSNQWFAATAQVPETVPPPPTPTPAPTPAPTPTPAPPPAAPPAAAPPPAAPPAVAPRPVTAPPPPPPAFNDHDIDNNGGSSDGDGNG